MASGRLYVFLHGLTVLSEGGPRGFELKVLLPHVMGHVYRAGTWLKETDLVLGSTLKLAGVKGDPQWSLSGSNVGLSIPNLSLKKNTGRSVTFLMPRPKDAVGLLRAPVQVTTNTRPSVTIAHDVATAQVLIYEFAHEEDIMLEPGPQQKKTKRQPKGHEWEPHSIGGAISLHIVSTSEGLVGEEHERETERALSSVIQGYPGLTFADHPPVPSWDSQQDKLGSYLQYMPPKAGRSRFLDCVTTKSGNEFAFCLEELEDFPARTQRLDRLGRMKVLNRNLNGLWREPDPLGEQLTTCFSIT